MRDRVARLKLILTMESDWHVGMGAGRRGEADRLLRRDADGLPYVPARTLSGIWRDACEIAARGLDNGAENGPWAQWVLGLFGAQPALETGPQEDAPSPARLRVTSARLPRKLRDALQSHRGAMDALTFLKPGVKIDDASGMAEDDMLRLEEMARKKAVLDAEAEVLLPEDSESRKDAFAILWAGTAMLERLGGKRRRGNGRCNLSISPWTDQDMGGRDEDARLLKASAKHLDEHKEPATPCPASVIWDDSCGPITYEAMHAGDTCTAWHVLDLEIEALSPILIPAETIGNVVRCRDFIPGYYLLPVVTRVLRQAGVDVGTAISQGSVVVTNATPMVGGKRGLPVPFAFFYEKACGGFNKEREKSGPVYNRLVERAPGGDEKQLKGYRFGYIGLSDHRDSVSDYQSLSLQAQTHNVVDDELQRPNEDTGGVYTYEAIPEGTKLGCQVRIAPEVGQQLDKADPKWIDVLNRRTRLGAARRSEYGEVQISVVHSCHVAIPTLNSAVNTASAGQKAPLTVWLLSETLLRDGRLGAAISVASLARQLEKNLGVKLTEPSGPGADGLARVLARQERVDSWQVQWTRPRPSLVGLAAGTCVVFETMDSIEPGRKALVEMTGIGERRAEGFGQVLIDTPLLKQKYPKLRATAKADASEDLGTEKPLVSLIPRAQPGASLISKGDRSSYGYARAIERGAWMAYIERLALHVAATPEGRKHAVGFEGRTPDMSQAGALRSVIGMLRGLDGASRLTAWMEHANTIRSDRWPPSALAAHGPIGRLVLQPDWVWALLEAPRNADGSPVDMENRRRDAQIAGTASPDEQVGHFLDLCLTADGRYELATELWPEAVRAVVDACVRAHKRNLEHSKEGHDNAE